MAMHNSKTHLEQAPGTFCATLDLREVAVRIALENQQAACSSIPSPGAAHAYALCTSQGILAERTQALLAQANTCARWVRLLLQ